jgi:hypothetical protein
MDKETGIGQASARTCQRASPAKDKETQKRKALVQMSMSNIPVLPSLPVLSSWIILILITSMYACMFTFMSLWFCAGLGSFLCSYVSPHFQLMLSVRQIC